MKKSNYIILDDDKNIYYDGDFKFYNLLKQAKKDCKVMAKEYSVNLTIYQLMPLDL